MQQDSIGIVMAMREEIRPLLQRLDTYRKARAGRFPLYLFQWGGRQIILIESGMGTKKAAAATAELLSYTTPRAIISAGLGGAVRQGLRVGDVIIAGQSLVFSEGTTSKAGTFQNKLLLPGLSESLSDLPFRIADGTVVTTSGIVNKSQADQLLDREVVNPVLDMETSAVAEAAARHGIPLIAVRSISDAADEELLFSLEEITDRELNIRIGKVLITIARKPFILPQMIRLAKNSKLAANNLAIVLEQLAPLVCPPEKTASRRPAEISVPGNNCTEQG
jgi:adenosylhomocysteine nucleosidase